MPAASRTSERARSERCGWQWGAPGLAVAFLIEGQLFTQKEIFCREGETWAQTETDEA